MYEWFGFSILGKYGVRPCFATSAIRGHAIRGQTLFITCLLDLVYRFGLQRIMYEWFGFSILGKYGVRPCFAIRVLYGVRPCFCYECYKEHAIRGQTLFMPQALFMPLFMQTLFRFILLIPRNSINFVERGTNICLKEVRGGKDDEEYLRFV